MVPSGGRKEGDQLRGRKRNEVKGKTGVLVDPRTGELTMEYMSSNTKDKI